MPFNPPKPPLHTSHSWKSPQQHPLHVDTSLEAKKIVIFCLYGPLELLNIANRHDSK